MSKNPTYRLALNDDNTVSVPSVEAACVASFYATSIEERSNLPATGFHLLAALMRIHTIAQSEGGIPEIKERLGEALLWTTFIHFVYKQHGDRSIQCKWFKSHEWAHRGPDRPKEDLFSILTELHAKVVRLAPALAGLSITPREKLETVAGFTLLPHLEGVVHGRRDPGFDLRAVCDIYKLSPRECYEAAISKRAAILEATHKQFHGKNATQDGVASLDKPQA